MNEKRNVPVPGEFYRHFKNRIYQIVTIAYHSETGDPMVVYQALYGDYKIWVRPLAMFMEKVDKEKYPEARQEYRFEPFTPSEGESGEDTGASDMENAVSPNPYLMEFLDALDSKNYDWKFTCLARLSGHVTQKELDDIYMVLDMHPAGGEIAEQLSAIRRHLLLLQKYDGERLR